MSLNLVQLTDCKRVVTYSSDQAENGFLVELVKEGVKTRAYITAVSPGCRKGYHFHRRRSCHFVVLRGSVSVDLVQGSRRIQFQLKACHFQQLKVPPGISLALINIGDDPAWVFNYSDPPYDPADLDEQVEESFDEVASRLALHS
jgi:dTDP-4-dehydrorhamnose 3,5-epimerase-like enzyme